jgi:hypothetical protein
MGARADRRLDVAASPAHLGGMKGPRRNDIPPPPTWARPREEWVWDGESWLWIPPTKADVAYLFKGEGRLSPRRCAEIIARGGEAAEECYRQLALRREVETTTAQESQEQAFAPYPDDNSTAETRDIFYPYLVRVAAAISGKPEWHNDTLTILRTLDEEHYNRIMDQAAMACKPAADYYGLPVEKVQRTLEALRAAERETTSRSATAQPRPDLPSELVAAMLKDSILGRLQEKFEKQLLEIELPEGGFTTIEQARAGGALAKTFRDLQKRREKLGLPPLERPDRVTEAATMAAYYYDHHTETGEFIPPRPRGRPPKTEAAPAT